MTDKPPFYFSEDTQEYSASSFHQENCITSIKQAKIVQVWQHNLQKEMQKIQQLVKHYNVVAIVRFHLSQDTEFPCIPAVFYCEKNTNLSRQHLQYQKLKKNVDTTKLIQLGLTISDQQGNLPIQQTFSWQFNFKYEENIEKISPSSAQLLKQSGINFQRLKEEGISYQAFSEQFLKSGLLFSKSIKWIAFHGCYDFSYLLQLIRNQPLPKTIQSFYKTIKIYFPYKLDLKYLIRFDEKLRKYGLARLAQTLQCNRIGYEHQAGSDSLLTLQCYHRIQQVDKSLVSKFTQCENVIFGIGVTQKSEYPNFQQYQYLQAQSLIQSNQNGYHSYQSESQKKNQSSSNVISMGNPLQDFLSQSNTVSLDFPLSSTPITRSYGKYQ